MLTLVIDFKKKDLQKYDKGITMLIPTNNEEAKMKQENERYCVEFYNGKGYMDFACGLVNIEDLLTRFAKDPARKAMIFDLEEGSFRQPVAIFEKLPKKRKWTRTL